MHLLAQTPATATQHMHATYMQHPMQSIHATYIHMQCKCTSTCNIHVHAPRHSQIYSSETVLLALRRLPPLPSTQPSGDALPHAPPTVPPQEAGRTCGDVLETLHRRLSGERHVLCRLKGVAGLRGEEGGRRGGRVLQDGGEGGRSLREELTEAVSEEK